MEGSVGRADGFSPEEHSISRGESESDRLAELGELVGLARRRTESDWADGFPRKRILYREARGLDRLAELGELARGRTGQTESDKSDDFSREALSISRGESGSDRLAELGELARGRTGQTESDKSDDFSREEHSILRSERIRPISRIGRISAGKGRVRRSQTSHASSGGGRVRHFGRTSVRLKI